VPAVLDVAATGVPQLPNLFVVTVGINKYRDKNLTLDYGAPDALSILQRLSQTSAASSTRSPGFKILDEAATREGILAMLDQLRQTRPDDIVAIYLAGHGEIIDNEWYYLPGDASIASEAALVRPASRQPNCATR